MMFAAPPRAKPGALELAIAAASAAAVRANFRDLFMSSILVWCHPAIGCAEKPGYRAIPPSGVQTPPPSSLTRQERCPLHRSSAAMATFQTQPLADRRSSSVGRWRAILLMSRWRKEATLALITTNAPALCDDRAAGHGPIGPETLDVKYRAAQGPLLPLICTKK